MSESERASDLRQAKAFVSVGLSNSIQPTIHTSNHATTIPIKTVAMPPAAAEGEGAAAAPGAAAELTRKRLQELAKGSGLQGLPSQGGERMELAAYNEAQQRLYFFGQVCMYGVVGES